MYVILILLKTYCCLLSPDDSLLLVPPEPNGFLHIGHSKAIAVNFGFAKYHGGECYLRLDDTNPEEEDKTFETSIIETVRWLGFEPKAVTYSSDNFDRLYQLAENLIETGGAYVCYCTSKQLTIISCNKARA